MVGRFLVKQLKGELAVLFFFSAIRADLLLVRVAMAGRTDQNTGYEPQQIFFPIAIICLGHNSAALKGKPFNARVLCG